LAEEVSAGHVREVLGPYFSTKHALPCASNLSITKHLPAAVFILFIPEVNLPGGVKAPQWWSGAKAETSFVYYFQQFGFGRPFAI
jgi:hypothetical protein